MLAESIKKTPEQDSRLMMDKFSFNVLVITIK